MENDHSIIDYVVLTPAERALVVEQAEALKVGLDGLIAEAKGGESSAVMKTFALAVIPHAEYITNVLGEKVKHTMLTAMERGGCEG